MSNPVSGHTTQTPTAGQHKWFSADFGSEATWKVASVAAISMMLLALLGVGLSTTASYRFAKLYWISLVPVFGIICVATAYRHSVGGHPAGKTMIMRQLLHWVGIAIAMGVDFTVRATGEETGRTAGTSALLLLALGCFLAGVHFEVLFMIVGALLTITLFITVKAEQYMWLIFVVGVVAIASLIAVQRYFGPRREKKLANAKSSHVGS